MKYQRFILIVFIIVFSGILGVGLPTHADEGRWLAQEQILLYGLGLRAEPEHQTVPKDIATIVSTYLQAPDSIPEGTLPIPEDAEVRATLRGPSLSQPVELVTRINEHFEIQPFQLSGIHTLENIRVVHNDQVILYATPESVTIEVIDHLLVTEVTARPLTAEEIQEKGIVFDSTNFQAYNFTAAFAVKPGQDITIDFPVLLPTLQSARGVTASEAGIPSLKPPQLQSIATIIPDTLKVAQTQIPNLMVKGFSFTIDEELAGELEAPTIPGVIIIPGDIGFLNQYFSVMLMVGNAAPEGSGLIVQDLLAELVLPAGNDTVVGSGDDPLAMAMTQQGESPRTQPVAKPGLDERLGTADDEDFIAPGETGNAEFLVEGRREGTHVIEMEISGILTGLPIGPVEIRGRAAGAVLVRNPSFTLTFTHPEIVNAGEEYDLDITVTNTSGSPANFVSVNLYSRNISGASLEGDETQEVETIPPGDSTVVSFRLRSHVTGTVFATTLDSDEKIAGRFELKTSVGELGIPLSPDSLVLPKEAGSLPEALRKASVALLGKAYAAATSPASALPQDVKRFTKNMVWDRAVEVAQAGLRYTLHEPISDTVKHLLFDFAGGNFDRIQEEYPEPDQVTDLEAAQNDFMGFDDLRRRSFRGDVFADEIAQILTDDLASLGLADFHAQFAETVSFRPEHLSVVIGTDGAPLPFRLILADDQGNALGEYDDENEKIIKKIPYSDYLVFEDAGGNATAQMALIASPEGTGYTIRLERNPDVPLGTPFSLSIVLPADTPSRLRQVVFSGVTGDNGVPVIEQVAGDPFLVTVEMVDNGGLISGQTLQPASASPITDPPPTVFSTVQMADADLICPPALLKVGRVVAALFSEEVTSESVQDRYERIDINNYAPENNEVVGVALQPGGRIVYLALRDPVGPFVERQMTILNATDLRGQEMTGPWTGPIEPTITDEPYGVVSGKVLNADGTPIPYADIRLFTYFCGGLHGISAKTTDADGNYTWDFVFNSSKVVAVKQEAGEFRSIPFTVQRHGQRLNLNIVFLGRGTLKGRAIAEDGFTLLPDTHIKVTSLTDYSEYGATTDEGGSFVIPDIPVGSILIEAVNIQYDGGQITSQSKLSVSDYIPETNALLERDLVLVSHETAQMTTQYGVVSGHVLESDGSTPIVGVPVVVYYLSNSQEGLYCPQGKECPVAMTTTGGDGSFFFEEIPAGDLRVYTFEQSRLLEGEAWITVEADSEAQVNVLLSGGLGTVSGIVLDADGNPVAGATVGGGMSLAITDENGRFVMTDVPVGGRRIVAVSQEIGSDGSVVVHLVAEGDEVGATIVLGSLGSVAGTIYETDGITPVPDLDVYLFYKSKIAQEIIVVGTAVTDGNGHYSMDKIPVRDGYILSAFRPDFSAGDTTEVPLKFHGQTVSADVTFRGSGRVIGTVFDDDGVTPLAARVSVSSLRVVRAGPVGVGFKYVEHVEIVENDFTAGTFSFNSVSLGNFVITAVGPFSPDPIAVSGIMPEDDATVNVTLQLQPTSEITGTVYDSDGATAVGQDAVVTFRGYKLVFYPMIGWVEVPQGIQEEIVTTDENGRFWLPVVNAGRYSITAYDPSTGKIGEINGMIRAGQTDDVSLRLLGLGDVTIRVLTSQGDPVPGAVVEAQQSGIQDVEKNGTTDAAGVIKFTMPEGDFTVLARNLQNGFAGRAPGQVTEDGEQLIVNVYLWDATGTVSGTVFGPDGITPVPNAEVMIENLQGPLGIVTSDDVGNYSMDTIPLGDFEVKVFEAATGRTGFEQGTIYLDGQEVPVNIVLFPVGYVTGNVLSAEDRTPVEGYRVMIKQPDPLGRYNPLNCEPEPNLTWFGTTGVDGGFAFPGIQLGTFEIIVGERGLGPIGCGTTFGDGAQQTIVESRITYEGEQVDIPVLVDLTKPPEGRVMGWVYNPDGTPAANTLISGIEAITTDTEGAFVYKDVPIGRYFIRAESQVTNDKGYAQTEIAFGGQTAYVRIILKGLGNMTGTVVDDAGVPAGNVGVTLLASGQLPLTIFADPQGAFSFENIPSGTFTVLAEDTVNGISGSTGGILLPGESVDVRVVLEPTESVTGVVLFSDQRPAPGITLVMTGSENTLYGETDTDGSFAFNAVPVGTYTLMLDDPIGTGLATRTVSVVDSAVDLGDIVLDDSLPEVVSTDPIAGAVNVSLDQTVIINFSKPIMPGTVTADSIVLTRDDREIVTGILTVGLGDTSVTLKPLSQLSDEARYTLWISAAPPFDELESKVDDDNSISQDEAVRYFPLLAKFDEYDTDGNGRLSEDEYPGAVEDRLGRVMQQEFACSFTTVDISPPAISDYSPAPSTGGVPVESVIRVSYSEPVNPNAFSGDAIELTMDQNPVDGLVDMILGNTAVVFTPALPLAQDTVYQVTILPATDLSGNVQSEGVIYDFSTTDSTPPVAQELILSDGGTVIQGGVGTANADTGSAFDVSFADFYINGELVFTDRQAPFEMNFEALAEYGSPGDTIIISVVLTDTSGNRGEAVESVFTIIEDSPPDINISSVSTGTDAETGQRVEITVHAEDDLGITTIAYQAVGGEHPAFGTVEIDPASISSDQDFAFYVPVDAVPGSTIVINATAVDTRGQTGEAIPAEVTVLDATNPVVAFAGMSSGDQVAPGEVITAVVSAQDFGGIASITFQVSGASTFSETRDISPAQDSVASTFTFTISPSATPPGSVVMQATVVDQAGNSAQAPSVILPVADMVPPTIVSMATESGSSTMVPGEAVTIIVEAADEVGLASIEISGSGAFTYSDAQPIVPPTGEAQASFVINVPGSLVDGDTLDLEARAVDISGNISEPGTLSLSVTTVPEVTMPASIILFAGDAQEVTLGISRPAPAGGLVIDLESEDTGIATVAASLSLNEGETSGVFTVNAVSGGSTMVNASIQGFFRSSMTVAIQGGVVSGTVYDPSMAPMAGANVNVNSLDDVTDSEGRFLVQGVIGLDFRYVRIQVTDPNTGLQGYHFGAMNVPNGFLRDVEIILVEAGSVVGTAVLQDNQTPAGEGVRVELFRANDLAHVIDSVFTDADSRFEFPIVALGAYVLETSDTNGNRGRVEITLSEADEEVSTVVPFLGRGTVSGIVIDAYGVAVPNAQVKLWAASIFGSENRTITADQNGTFVFDDVFIGTFSVTAEDTATHMAAKEDGTIDYHEHTVNLTMQLGSWASLEGTVYRADGTTTVSGARVYVGNISTTTNVNGQYRFEVLPLGSYTVKATEQATRGLGTGTIALDTLGETGLLDITFSPQGTLIVTVEDFNGDPVDGASVRVEDTAEDNLPFVEQRNWEILATTDGDGVAVINYVLEGLFKINATFGYLTGEKSGSIAADEILPVTVNLEPVGSIEGTVFEPDGNTPAQNVVRVGLVERSVYTDIWGTRVSYREIEHFLTDENGVFVFENVPINDQNDNPIQYRLDAYEGGELDPVGNYSGGQLRARVDDLVLESNGQIITRDLTLIGIGTVTGRVIMPDSSSASEMLVTLESHTPVFARTYSTTTNAYGEYTIERVPVGDFTVSSGNPNQQLLGEAEGTVSSHLEAVTEDIILQTNAFTLPEDLYDGNIFRYDLQPDGTIRSGKNLFDYNGKGGCSLDIISEGSTYTFPETGVATQESSGREIVVKETNLGGINVTRKIYVPENAYFARYLEILSNTSPTDITVDLRISSDFYDYYISSTYPNETAAIVTTSSGDDQLQAGVESPDLWVTVDDNKPEDPFVNTYNNIPPSAFIWAGPDAGAYPDSAVLTPYDTDTSSPANLSVQWSNITVPAGESVAIIHFVVQHANQEAARACADRLTALPPEALSGLNLSEIARVKNFDIPADGSSLLSPLPPITEGAEISGKVLAGDGVTPPYYTNARISLKSSNIYFSRTYRSGYPDAEGNFSFISDTTTNTTASTRIPLADFTLWADYTAPQTGYGYTTLSSPPFTGVFPLGSTSATLDVVFSNTGELQGTVRKDTGDPVENADVRILYSGQIYTLHAYTGADGSFFMPFLLPGDYTVQTIVSPPAGNEGNPIIIDSPTQTITAGEATGISVSLPPLGSISGTIYTHEGTPVENVQIVVRDTATSFYRRTFTDAGGVYQLSDLPVGDYVLTAYDPDTNAPTTASVHVTAQETSSADITLPYTVDLPMDLFDGNGFRWDIQTDGRIQYGTNNAYYYYSYGGLDLYRITLPDAYYDDFSGSSDAIAEDEGRELLIGPHVFSGRDLEVNRKIFIPEDEAFARYLEILQNTGTGDMTVRIQIRTYLGSGGDTVIVQTSSGDRSFSVDDDFIITDDEDGTGTPTMVHVFSGPNAEVESSEIETYQSSSYFRMGYYFDVTIPAGERRIVMHFASQNASRTDASASAAALHCLQGRALAGLAPEEQADIVNFVAFPDTDCDGLIDEEENNLGTDPNDPDTDDDGLNDKFEVDYSFDPLLPGDETGDPDNDGLDNAGEQTAGTDPHNPDSDDDGFSDGDEVNVFHTDPTSAVIRITDGIAASDQADFAIDNLGNLHVVWTDDRHNDGNNNDEIYYAMLNSGGGTLIDDTRLSNDSSRSRRPAIAIDTQNRAHIAWQDKRLNNTPEIFYTAIDPSLHSQDGSSGDDAVMALVDDSLLSIDDSDRSDTPRLRVDSQDRVHIVWSETDRGEVQYARLEVDVISHIVNVTISRAIFSAGASRWYPAHTDLALDSEGNVHVAWLDHRDTSAVEIFYEMLDSDTGATLIDETVLTVDDGYDAQYPSISIGPGDEITVVFGDYRLGANEVFMVRFNPALDDQDGSMAEVSNVIVLPETLISPEDGVDSAVPTGVVDAQGNVRVTYFDNWESGDNYPAEPHLLAADRRGNPISDTALTQSTTATTGTEWSRGYVKPDGITSYVVWTDDRFGMQEVILQVINPDRDRDGLVDADELLQGTDPDDDDTDNDDLLDGFEVTYGLDPLSPGDQNQDPDGDTLSNLDEQAAGTDPNKIDTDGDGLNDNDELTYGADPNYADTDNDGLTDGDEVHNWHSDPTLVDSDGDGLLDGFEAANGFDPSTEGEEDDDPDTDGLDNLSEQNLGTDPHNPDSDEDGATDGDEVNTHGTEPLVADTDEDGLLDGFEIDYGMNPLQTGDEVLDPDNDDLNNLDEQTAGTDPQNPDTDSDGLLDGFEVIYGFNPLSDPGAGEGDLDPDTDGLNNLGEQTHETDPLQPDSDWDMLTDGDEVNTHSTNPTLWDTDMDQLSDGEEVNGIHGYITIPTNPDTDGGGRTDGEEIWTDGTDPLNPDDDIVPVYITEGEGVSDQSAVAVDSAGNIHVVWADDRTGSYQLYYSMLSSDKSTVIDDTRLSDTTTSAQHPSLAIDNLKVIHIVWQDAGSTSNEIYHMAIDPSLDDQDGTPALIGNIEGVSAHLISTDDGVASSKPKLASDSSGRLHGVWGDTDAGEIHYTRLGGDGTIQITDQIIFNAGSALTWGSALPNLAVDSSDNVHVAWMNQISGVFEIFYAMLNGDTGGILIDTTQITSDDGFDSRYPSVGIGPGNEVTVVYDNEAQVAFGFPPTYFPGCEVAMLRINPALDDQNGGAATVGSITTLPETTIYSRTFTTTLPPSATVDADGNVYVSYYYSYSAPRGSLNFVVVNSSGYPITDTKYLTNGTTATTTGDLTLPSVAINDSILPGTSYITWTDDQSGNPEILLHIIEP